MSKSGPNPNSIRDGIEHEPTGGAALINPADTLLLLLDHQAGLFQVVKDIEVAQLRANTTMLAKLATLLKLPVMTTASVPEGPNGPLMPEIHEAAPQPPPRARAPRIGEHNDEVLKELGFTTNDIDGFRASGTIPHASNLESAASGGGR